LDISIEQKIKTSKSDYLVTWHLIPEEENTQLNHGKNLKIHCVVFCFYINALASITLYLLQFIPLSDRHALNIETEKLRQQNTELRRLLHFYVETHVSTEIFKLRLIGKTAI
jgi:hypothetical protein